MEQPWIAHRWNSQKKAAGSTITEVENLGDDSEACLSFQGTQFENYYLNEMFWYIKPAISHMHGLQGYQCSAYVTNSITMCTYINIYVLFFF